MHYDLYTYVHTVHVTNNNIHFIGFIVIFGINCSIGFHFFHIFHLFYGLAYPHQAKLWMDSKTIRTRIHITEVLIVVVFAIVLPVLTISTSTYRDTGLFCASQATDLTIYLQIIPYAIIMTTSLSLLFCCLWMLHKVSVTVKFFITFIKHLST